MKDGAVARWEALSEFAPDASMLVASDGHILALNSRAATFFGYQAEELSGSSFQELLSPPFHGDDGGSFEDLISLVESSSEASGPRILGLSKEGEEFPIELRFSRMDSGDSELFWIVVRDISKAIPGERLRATHSDQLQQLASERTDQLGGRAVENESASADLRAATKRLVHEAEIQLLVLDALDEGVIVTSVDGGFELFNPAAERMLGLGALNVPADRWGEVYGLYDTDGLELDPSDVPLRAVLETGESVERELLVRNATTNELRRHSVIGHPLRSEAGELVGAVVVFRDITDERRAEEFLKKVAADLENQARERTLELEIAVRDLKFEIEERKAVETALTVSKQRLAALADSLPALIAYVNRDLKYEFANRQYFHWFGRKPEELTGTYIKDIVGKPFEMIRPAAEKALRGEMARLDGTITHAALGLRTVEITYVPDIQQGEVLGFYALIHDVTDRVRAERQAMQDQHDLAHVTRVVMLGEFTAGIAHELGQPLTSISSNAQAGIQLLSSEKVDVDEIKAILDDVVADGRRAADIVRKLHSLVKRGSTSLENVDMNSVAESAVKLAASRITESGIVVEFDLAPALPEVAADTVQMQQVILNLVSNSIDAIGARGLTHGDGRVLVSTGCEANLVLLSVQDNGIGIRPKYAEAIFERFYSTKSNGLGMGLAISKSIIKSFGGSINARPADQGGLIVEIRLPIAKQYD